MIDWPCHSCGRPADAGIPSSPPRSLCATCAGILAEAARDQCAAITTRVRSVVVVPRAAHPAVVTPPGEEATVSEFLAARRRVRRILGMASGTLVLLGGLATLAGPLVHDEYVRVTLRLRTPNGAVGHLAATEPTVRALARKELERMRDTLRRAAATAGAGADRIAADPATVALRSALLRCAPALALRVSFRDRETSPLARELLELLGSDAIRWIEPGLEGSKRGLRLETARLLTELGPMAEPARDSLLRALAELGDEDEEMRLALFRALSAALGLDPGCGDRIAGRPLGESLDSTRPEIASAAVDFCARLGSAASGLLQDQRWTSTRGLLRRAWLSEGRLTGPAAEVLSALGTWAAVPVVHAARCDPALQSRAVAFLASLPFPPDEAEGFVLDQARTGDPIDRRAAIDALARIAQPSLAVGDLLVATLTEPRDALRAAAARGLDRVTVREPMVLPLVEALGDPLTPVRAAAARALLRFAESERPSMIPTTVFAARIEALLARLTDDEADVRAAALLLLDWAGPLGPDLAGPLIERARDADAGVRRQAVETLASVTDSAAARREWVERLGDSSSRVRIAAFQALQRLGAIAPDDAELLDRLRREPLDADARRRLVALSASADGTAK